MAINDQLVDIQREHAVDVLRVVSGHEKKIQGIMDDLEVLLQTAIFNADFGKRPATRQKRVEELLQQVNPDIKSAYREMRKENNDLLLEMSETEMQFQTAEIAAVLLGAGIGAASVPSIGRDKLKVDLDRTMIEGVPISVWWERAAQDLATKLKDNINESLVTGQKNIVGYIFGDESRRFFETQRRAVSNIARTTVHKVVNQTKLLAYTVNPNINGVQQISVFDSRTSPVCVAYGGKIWNKKMQPVGHALPWNGGPPRHFNCRSSIAPVYDLKKPSPDMDYSKWLNTRPPEQQDRILGPNRAGLFREGKLPLSELVNQSGRTLTIAELKKKLNIST